MSDDRKEWLERREARMAAGSCACGASAPCDPEEVRVEGHRGAMGLPGFRGREAEGEPGKRGTPGVPGWENEVQAQAYGSEVKTWPPAAETAHTTWRQLPQTDPLVKFEMFVELTTSPCWQERLTLRSGSVLVTDTGVTVEGPSKVVKRGKLSPPQELFNERMQRAIANHGMVATEMRVAPAWPQQVRSFTQGDYQVLDMPPMPEPTLEQELKAQRELAAQRGLTLLETIEENQRLRQEQRQLTALNAKLEQSAAAVARWRDEACGLRERNGELAGAVMTAATTAERVKTELEAAEQHVKVLDQARQELTKALEANVGSRLTEQPSPFFQRVCQLLGMCETHEGHTLYASEEELIRAIEGNKAARDRELDRASAQDPLVDALRTFVDTIDLNEDTVDDVRGRLVNIIGPR